MLVSKNRPIGAPAFSAAAAFTCFAALGLVACSASDEPAGSAGAGSVTAGSGNGSGGSKPAAGGAPGTGTAGQTTTFAGSGGSSGAVPGGTSGAGPGGGAPQGGATGQAGAAGTGQAGAAHVRDHCLEGYDPDPSDATMKDGPAEFVKSGQIDLTVQPEVLAWFKARVWEEAHFQWHNIRRCTSNMATDSKEGGGVNPCKTHPQLIPVNQENKGAGDGLEFLAMHRHMIQSLKQLWPKHTEQFEGWNKFPTKADVPQQWQAAWSEWPANVTSAAAKADDPASNMSQPGFESEGAFGQWLQSTSGLHGALHFKWVRSQNSDHGLGNQFKNIDNYMFWKMHGWIDKVWDKYRAAKGKTPNDQDIKDAVLQQCRQMDQLAIIVKPSLGEECTPAPKQSGVFVDTIRPIFESDTNKCTGCHGRSGPNGNLTLGGSTCVKSSDIVAAMVNKPALGGGQFKLIEPGNADKSWLYLKVTGKAATAGCTGANCVTGTMPQGGVVTLTQAQQDALKKWINDGAVAPQ
jgi:hypothetical protein